MKKFQLSRAKIKFPAGESGIKALRSNGNFRPSRICPVNFPLPSSLYVPGKTINGEHLELHSWIMRFRISS